MNPWLLLTLLALTAFISWRLSRTEADPDWAMFNLAAFTGSWYGRDWADCKTPVIHVWYWLIAKITGPHVARVKFANHFIIGAAGAAFYMITGEFTPALIYTIMVNSGWMWAFHGNVSQIPAALLFMSMATDNPAAIAILVILAVLTDPKLLPAAIAIFIIQTVPALTIAGTAAAIGVACLIIVGIIALKADISAGKIIWWIWEGSVTIPLRMSKNRGGLYTWMPWWTAKAVLYIGPWLALAIWSKPDLVYWIPAILYLAVISSGQVIRQNHLLPLIPWIAGAGSPPEFAIGLAGLDYFSAGFYFGDLWTRFYRGFGDSIKAAAAAGRFLEKIPGKLWVTGMHTEVYIYARRPVPYGLAEQIEIREVAHERRKLMQQRWKKEPAEIVVETESANVQFVPKGYTIMANNGPTRVWRKTL